MTKISDKITATSGSVELQATRTNEIDLTVTSTASSWSTVEAKGHATKDSNGTYRLVFNLRGTHFSSSGHDIIIGGITFLSTAAFYQPVLAQSGVAAGAEGNTRAFTSPGTSEIFTDWEVQVTETRMSGHVILNSKPDWFDDNLMTASGLPVATADTYGVIKRPHYATGYFQNVGVASPGYYTFNVPDKDASSMITANTGTITIPRDGTYKFTMMGSFDVSGPGGVGFELEKNGSITLTEMYNLDTTTAGIPGFLYWEGDLVQGDTLRIQEFAGAGLTRTPRNNQVRYTIKEIFL